MAENLVFLYAIGDADTMIKFIISLTVIVVIAMVVAIAWVKTKANNEIIDNYGKECRPLNKRVEDGGFSYDATCSLCGGRIGLWPHCDDKCSKCGATVIH